MLDSNTCKLLIRSLQSASDPTFISSSFIPDEEKIYFFFSEVGREYDFIDKFIVSRVSQICMVSLKQQASWENRSNTKIRFKGGTQKQF